MSNPTAETVLEQGPVLTFKVPEHECYRHGSHTAWVYFSFGEGEPKPNRYCMRCIRDFLKTHGIGTASD